MRYFLCSIFLILLTACAGTDTVLRPERTTFIRQKSESQKIKIFDGHDVVLECFNWRGLKDPQINKDQCLYYAVESAPIYDIFATAQPDDATKAMRNRYISFLVGVSEQNCSTFLGRAFANKSSTDTARNIFQDVLTGTSTAVANAAPQTAAGVGLLNLVVGKSVDNLNTSFYFEQTFQALAAAITSIRDDVKKEILIRQNLAYSGYTIFDAVSDIRRYDDACSVRVGLAKLQDLAQDAKKAKDDSAAAKKQLEEKSAQLIDVTKKLQDVRKEYETNDKKLSEVLAKLDRKPPTKNIGDEIEKIVKAHLQIDQAATKIYKEIDELNSSKRTEADEEKKADSRALELDGR